MVGIKSYGAYVPRYRIDRKTITAAIGFLGGGGMPGEKSVAGTDEDSITMAVAAGLHCLEGVDRSKVGGVYLGTTTQPYLIRQNAGIISCGLDLETNIRVADFVGSTKSGTAALLSAFDAINSGVDDVVVCASDHRLAKPGSSLEQIYGDGAAAALVGKDNLVAVLEGSFSVFYDFQDKWRATGEKFEHVWEDRFARDVGYQKFIPEAISGLLKKYGLNIKDFAKVAYPAFYAREHANIAKQLGIGPGQLQESLLNKVGDTGSAEPLLMLVGALETAKPGDRILVASYGSGSDAMSFRVTDKIGEVQGKSGLKKHLAHRKEMTSYEKYLAFNNLIPVDTGLRGEEGTMTPMSALFRDRKMVLSMHGTKCKRCGVPQYPAHRICVNPECGAIDETEEYPFWDKKGVLFTYTGDNLAANIDPPSVYGLVDFEGGGRARFDFADCDLESLRVGMPVVMTFRRRYLDEGRGVYGYFWKAMPVTAVKAE